MNINIDDKISITIMSESGERVDVTGVISKFNDKNPFAKFSSSRLNDPQEIELPSVRIESNDGELQYMGDIAGAILIPDFLWSK